MKSLKMFFIFSALAVYNVAADSDNSLDDCFKTDSITCLQLKLFRNARDFFSKDKIDMFAGLSLTKSSDTRTAKSSDNILDDNKIESAKSFEDREDALEQFLLNKVQNFFADRSITLNLGQAARSIASTLPENVKTQVNDLITEGRGKKKILSKIIPFIIAIKLKIIAVVLLAYFGIAIVAKKALLAALVSIAISGFIALKKLLAHKQDHHDEYTSYHAGGYGGGYGGHSEVIGGWNGAAYDPHSDLHGSYSSPSAQHIAYSGQKVKKR